MEYERDSGRSDSSTRITPATSATGTPPGTAGLMSEAEVLAMMERRHGKEYVERYRESILAQAAQVGVI